MSDSDSEIAVQKKKSEAPKTRKPMQFKIPRRKRSLVPPPNEPVYISADKTTCLRCPCFPIEDPYDRHKKLNNCQKSPLKLYELAALAVDRMQYPAAFAWSPAEVAEWMSGIGLPEYRECILDNNINGRRLLCLEDASVLPKINIHNFEHIKLLTSKVRSLFKLERVLFNRSVGLPIRKPLTHTTQFKSKTGPNWGIRTIWERSDILRWMEIINPKPIHRDHWDLVWYRTPDFPKTRFAKIPKADLVDDIPHYRAHVEMCTEYLVPRKFRIQPWLPEAKQMIWMEHLPESPFFIEMEKKKRERAVPRFLIKEDSRLLPKKISLRGLKGEKLILARRKMPKAKFFAVKV